MKRVLVVALLVGVIVASRIDVSFFVNLSAIRWAKILIEQQTLSSCEFPYYRSGQLSGVVDESLGKMPAVERGFGSKEMPAPYVLAEWTLSPGSVSDDVLRSICTEAHPAARVVCARSRYVLEDGSCEEVGLERVDLYFVKLGMCFSRNLQYDEAETAYSIATGLAPEHGDAHLALARLYQRLGDPRSLEHYEKADKAFVERPPGLGISMASFHASYGDALLGQGRLGQAEQEYLLALAHSPNRFNPWLGLAQIKFETESPARALEYIVIANRLSPTNAKVYYWMGGVYVEHGDLDRALVLLNESRLLDPDRQTTLWALAHAYEQKGSWREAAQIYCDLSVLDPQDDAAVRELERLGQEFPSQIRCPTSR